MDRVVIIDYGMGNLRSVQKAFEFLGADAVICPDGSRIDSADLLVLPGVGEFGAAMRELDCRNLIEPLRAYAAAGRKLLGICLGMQLVMEESEESPGVRGLGVFKGTVKRFPRSREYPVPQIGWNTVRYAEMNTQLFRDIPQESYFYFVHSYYVSPTDSRISAGVTDYGMKYTSILAKDNIVAAQFHPEKSQKPGLRLLKNILEM